MKTFSINQNDAGHRLDKFMSKVLDAPQGMIFKALRKKRVRVNGKHQDGAYRLSDGDRVDLYINDEFFQPSSKPDAWMKLTPELDVIYEDENLIVMNKPAGLLSQAEAGQNVNSLESHMRAYLYHKRDFDPAAETTFLPSLCHRIDRNTSGLVIGAKNAGTLRAVNTAIKNREIKKFYRCEVEGTPNPLTGQIDGFVKKNPRENKMLFSRTAQPGAVPCSTKYHCISVNGRTSLVEVELLTGRTHQIRASMAAIGCPIAGDVKYGATPDGKRRFQHLTAYKLIFALQDTASPIGYLTGKVISL